MFLPLGTSGKFRYNYLSRMNIQEHEDTMSVMSGMTTSSLSIQRQDPGRIVTHQAAQEWSDPGKN